jgi:Fe-S-cluster-containing dehydrogenase component
MTYVIAEPCVDTMDQACVAVCPTHCFTFGDLDDPQSAISRVLASRKAHPLLPAAGTKPRIYYLD